MKKCISCGVSLKENDVFCTNCGTEQPTQKKDGISKGTIIMLVALVIFTIVGVIIIIDDLDKYVSEQNKALKLAQIVNKKERPEDAVRGIYLELLEEYKAIAKGEKSATSYNPYEKFCTQDFLALIKHEQELIPEGEIGVIDYDLWTFSQDYNPNLSLSEVNRFREYRPDSVWDIANLVDIKSRERKYIILAMKKDTDVWKVSDFLHSTGDEYISIRNELQDAITNYTCKEDTLSEIGTEEWLGEYGTGTGHWVCNLRIFNNAQGIFAHYTEGTNTEENIVSYTMIVTPLEGSNGLCLKEIAEGKIVYYLAKGNSGDEYLLMGNNENFGDGLSISRY